MNYKLDSSAKQVLNSTFEKALMNMSTFAEIALLLVQRNPSKPAVDHNGHILVSCGDDRNSAFAQQMLCPHFMFRKCRRWDRAAALLRVSLLIPVCP
jgi:hypothetical protein